MDSTQKSENVCGPCNKTFGSSRALRRHIRENKAHRQDPDFTCDICNKTFTRAHDLARHLDEQHGNGKVPCARCMRVLRPGVPHKDGNGNACCPIAPKDICSTPKHALESESDSELDAPSTPPNTRLVALDKTTELPLRLAVQSMPTFRTSLLRSIPCGICKRRFVPRSPAALFDHMALHFDEFKASHGCSVCQINFKHRKDLKAHLSSAEQGDCGFSFSHKEPCNGHHPPSHHCQTTQLKRLRMSEDDNSDRFDFCYRIRTWEHAQLQSWQWSIEEVVEAQDWAPHSEPYATHGPRTSAINVVQSAATCTNYWAKINHSALSSASCAESADKDAVGSRGFLVRACMANNTALIADLIDAGTPVDRADESGLYPLNTAAEFGHIKAMQLLLQAGAHADKDALKAAILSKNDDAVHCLISAEASLSKTSLGSAFLSTDPKQQEFIQSWRDESYC